MSVPDTMFDMQRSHLLDIPQIALPDGYRFRAYQDGDGVRWRALQVETEPFIPITPDYFERQFGLALNALPDRMFFVENDAGEIAGTITAWWEHDRTNPNERGRIHWVAVHPRHQRRGIAKPMMTHAMNRLAQEYGSAMLGTSSGRPWAVKVYLDFGFLPEPAQLADPEIHAAWVDVQSLIEHPALAAVLASN
jgi:ribosomal protein S18 acetylase RimI-like enzyme